MEEQPKLEFEVISSHLLYAFLVSNNIFFHNSCILISLMASKVPSLGVLKLYEGYMIDRC